MVKTRLSSIDILSITSSFNIHPSPTQPHYRLANIYSTTSTASASASISSSSNQNRHYILKLGHSKDKLMVYVESGRRIHSTTYKRSKEKIPNPFCLKLRKFIKGRRLESINQIGLDRVIHFDFGGFYLIMEFYAKGNIILTDENWKILTLLRRHDKGEEDVKYAVGETYPVQLRKQFQSITREKIDACFDAFIDDDSIPSNKKQKANLLTFLNRSLDYGPDIILHCLLKGGFSKKTSLAKFYDWDNKVGEAEVEQNKQSLVNCLQEADQIITQLKENKSQEGYIFLKKGEQSDEHLDLTPDSIQQQDGEAPEIPKELRARYDTFHPIIFEQYKDTPRIHFDSYNNAVDEFFSVMEHKQVENQKLNIERSVEKRLDRIKQEQKEKVENLEQNVAENQFSAQLIECNLDIVERAINTVNVALNQSLPWEEIREIIAEQSDMGDEVACIIQKFDFEQEKIGLLLKNQIDPEDEKEYLVMVDLTKTAYANVEDYFSRKKRANYKKERTLDNQEKVLKNAEEKSKERISQAHRLKADITKMRKPFWFEKFNWFITSENFLVISGRDAQQNELIVNRHLRKGDIYIHADIHGASSCILKNPNPSQSVPQLSIQEACNYCVCRSKAWDAKLGGTSAWWVYDDQVSKSAPSGEYLPTGSFMVRGKKNYVPHCPLVMGFGVMFRVTDDDVKKHIGERKIRGASDNISHYESDSPGTLSDTPFAQSPLPQRKDADFFDQNSSENDSTGDIRSAHETTSDEDQVQQRNSSEEALSGDDQGPENHVDRMKRDYAKMTNVEKKKTFNSKDKKKLKQLVKKGTTEDEAIQQIVNIKLEKLDQITDEAKETQETEEQDRKVASEKKRKQKPQRAKKTKKQRKIAAKLDEMDEEDKQRMREYLGVKEEIQEEDKTDREKKIERIQQEQKRKKREEKKMKQFFDRENIPYMTEEERKNVTQIDTLTSQPLDDDTVLFAVPMCGPYRVFKNFKYKFKLTPGSGKRGKLAKTIHQTVQKQIGGCQNDSEAEAVRRISNDEMVLSLMSNAQLARSKKKKK